MQLLCHALLFLVSLLYAAAFAQVACRRRCRLCALGAAGAGGPPSGRYFDTAALSAAMQQLLQIWEARGGIADQAACMASVMCRVLPLSAGARQA